MVADAERLKPTEAAVVAHVALREVNRVIDESILPAGLVLRNDGRLVLAIACPLIAFYYESASRLTADERLSVMRAGEARLRRFPSLAHAARPREDWVVRDAFLAVDLRDFVVGASERLDRLVAARKLVTSSPDVLDGTPVICGTRIPVHDIAASLAAGVPVARIIAAWPGLDADKVALAALYAEANPARGRPRALPALPKGAVLVSERRVARRARAG